MRLLRIFYIVLFIFLLSSCSTKDKINEISHITAEIVPTQIESSGLPDYHLIKTTFVPQAPEKDWGQPWQDACEEAAVLTAIYYQKHQNPQLSTIKQDLLSLVSYETSQGWGNSVNVDKLSQLIKDNYQIPSTILTNPTIDDIKKLIAADIPVLVPANGKTLFKENSHFKQGGPWYHFVVILGYNDRSQEFIVHDVGTQFGAYFHYSYKLLLSAIHDLPPSDDIQQINEGVPKVIYLLK
jgi:hypothetical protein